MSRLYTIDDALDVIRERERRQSYVRPDAPGDLPAPYIEVLDKLTDKQLVELADSWQRNEWVRPGVVGGDPVPRNRGRSVIPATDSEAEIRERRQARWANHGKRHRIGVKESVFHDEYHPRPKRLSLTHRLRRLFYSDRRWYRYLERMREKNINPQRGRLTSLAL